MNVLKTLNSAMFCAAAVAMFGAKANADVVPVVDPYFNELPAGQSPATFFQVGCGTGCAFADKPIVGWTSSVTRSATGDSGQWQIGQVTNNFNSDPMINASTPEPIVVRAINATVSQVVSTDAVAGVTYTLDVDLGFEKTAPDAASVDLIVDGHQVLASPLASYHLTQKQMQETGNWYDFEASYTATKADAGAPIEILLSSLTNGNGFGFFGDVRLTDSLTGPQIDPPATPEPTTWAMILIGFGGMAGAAAMSRSSRRRSAAGQLA
jgi:PEP-CTERM motif